MKDTVNLVNITYNEEQSCFDFSAFNKSMLGSRIVAMIGKRKAIVDKINYTKSMNEWGEYEQWIVDFMHPKKKTFSFTGKIKVYNHCVIFEIVNHQDIFGKKNKSPNGNPYISFPSFEGERFDDQCSCLSYKRQAPFNYPEQWFGCAVDCIREGKNIPLIITNKQYETLVLSPLNHMLYGTVSINKLPMSIRCGMPRSFQHLKSNTSYKTVLTYGIGVNETLEHWGSLLQNFHGTGQISIQEDCLLKYISYWTNAGSAYWYRTFKKQSYDATFRKLVDHHKDLGLEFGSYQLDSWWYKKDGNNYTSAIIEWEPKEETVGKNFNSFFHAKKKYITMPLFKEDKLSYVQSIVQTPIGCHFKQISTESPYIIERTQDFVLDEFALPKDETIAYQLFSSLFDHPKWNMAFVVHDWIQWMMEHHFGFKSISTGEGYFKGLDRACLDIHSDVNNSKHLSLQLCMTHPAVTLNSVTMASVTSIRSTSDSRSFFVEGPRRWRWHLYSSLLIQMLGKYGFYDNRFTSRNFFIHSKKQTEMELIWLTLSCGPIGIGDKIGKENIDIIRKVIKENGEIIKPDQAARPLDSAFLFNPNEGTGEHGVTVYSDTLLSDQEQKRNYRIIYALHMNMNIFGRKVKCVYEPSELGLDEHMTYMIYNYTKNTFEPLEGCEKKTISLTRNFEFQIMAPLYNGFAFFGDRTKYIGASRQLVKNIMIRNDGVEITIICEHRKFDGQWICFCDTKPQKVLLDKKEILFSYERMMLMIRTSFAEEYRECILTILF